eukprot:367473-Rhodomonas_salina.2
MHWRVNKEPMGGEPARDPTSPLPFENKSGITCTAGLPVSTKQARTDYNHTHAMPFQQRRQSPEYSAPGFSRQD